MEIILDYNSLINSVGYKHQVLSRLFDKLVSYQVVDTKDFPINFEKNALDGRYNQFLIYIGRFHNTLAVYRGLKPFVKKELHLDIKTDFFEDWPEELKLIITQNLYMTTIDEIRKISPSSTSPADDMIKNLESFLKAEHEFYEDVSNLLIDELSKNLAAIHRIGIFFISVSMLLYLFADHVKSLLREILYLY